MSSHDPLWFCGTRGFACFGNYFPRLDFFRMYKSTLDQYGLYSTLYSHLVVFKYVTISKCLMITHGWIYMFNWDGCGQVYEAKWWACMYGAPTAKRHIGWRNCPTVACLDLGKMIKAYHNRGPLKSSKTYTNKRGKKAFCGSTHLKSTGTLASCYCRFFFGTFDFPTKYIFRSSCALGVSHQDFGLGKVLLHTVEVSNRPKIDIDRIKGSVVGKC